MPLGSRDILFVLRAQDFASREIQKLGGQFGRLNSQLAGVGASMVAIGAGMATIGGAGLSFFSGATKGAIETRQAMALAVTQAKDVGASIEDLTEISERVGAAVPVPYEQLGEGLYDIFSSIDVNMQEAEKYLSEFSKAAVAGQVDLQDASRTSIAIMNAFPDSGQSVNDILDIQFRMVEKGIGTYDEFSGALGRALPAANRAGQSFETLAGMMTFLTRNGLSTEMAATSAARGLEALAHPKTVSRLSDMGISVKDAAGELRPMRDIVDQLSGKLKSLPGPERAAALTELFKGAGGTIQARRFWDMAITNSEQFGIRLDEIANRGGAMERAYDIMFEQPQSQIQLLKNNWKILNDEIGGVFLPHINRGVELVIGIIQAFRDLPPGMQETIIKLAAFSALIATISGVIIAGIGAFLLLAGAVGGVGTAALLLLGIPAILAGIIAAAWLVYQNWETIWGGIKAAWDAFVMGFRLGGDSIGAGIQGMVGGWEAFGATVRQIWEGLVSFWHGIVAAATALWQGFLDQLWWWWYDNGFSIKQDIENIWNGIVAFWNSFVAIVKTLWSTFLAAIKEWWAKWGGDITATAQKTLKQVLDIMKSVWDAVLAVWRWAVEVAKQLWSRFGEDIIRIGSALWSVLKVAAELFWKGLKNMIDGALRIIKGIFEVFAGIFTGDWSRLWGGIQQIVSGIWAIILGIFQIKLAAILAIASAKLAALAALVAVVFDTIMNVFRGGWNAVVTMFGAMMRLAKKPFEDAPKWFQGIGEAMIRGIIRGITNMAGAVGDAAAGVVRNAMSAAKRFLKIGSPSKLMADIIGMPMMQGVEVGIKAQTKDAERTLQNALSRVVDVDVRSPMVGVGTAARGAAATASSGGSVVTVHEGAVQLNIQGNVTEDAMPDVQAAIDEAFYRLTLELRRG